MAKNTKFQKMQQAGGQQQTDASQQADPILKISPDAQKALVEYCTQMLVAQQKFMEMRNKMIAVDTAYARYREGDVQAGQHGVDVLNDKNKRDNLDSVYPPIVVSQVDSMVGYLAEVFLSGYPMFPVVSTPDKVKQAEMLETIIDDHATIGGYARQLMMFFFDGCKYNFSALEADWSTIEQYTLTDDFLASDNSSQPKQKLGITASKYTKIKRLDPYNIVWDWSVSPGDVQFEGDYAGYLDILSRVKFKRLCNRLSKERVIYNQTTAEQSKIDNANGVSGYYYVPPTVNEYINPKPAYYAGQINWESWIKGGNGKEDKSVDYSNVYEVFTCYARIIPADFGIVCPMPNTPQIFKLRIVNTQVLLSAERIFSAYDALPILFGQPLEDGMKYMTKGIGENAMPYQSGVKTLMDIRFNAARRAVSDRALYDPDMIRQSDINAPVPAPKIPVRTNMLLNRTIDSAYKQIPFDARGTEGVMQDAMTLTNFGKDMAGLNSAQQGQFQPGNKSVKEWNDTMAGGENRQRLRALCLEFQVFIPLKNMIKLNIYQYGEDALVVNQQTGQAVEVKMAELRQTVLAFRIADGYTPKSKLAGADVLQTLFNTICQVPALQQAYGQDLPAMFAHLAQLGGVRGLDQYSPQAQANLAANPVQPDAAGTPPTNQQPPAQPPVQAPVAVPPQA